MLGLCTDRPPRHAEWCPFLSRIPPPVCMGCSSEGDPLGCGLDPGSRILSFPCHRTTCCRRWDPRGSTGRLTRPFPPTRPRGECLTWQVHLDRPSGRQGKEQPTVANGRADEDVPIRTFERKGNGTVGRRSRQRTDGCGPQRDEIHADVEATTAQCDVASRAGASTSDKWTNTATRRRLCVKRTTDDRLVGGQILGPAFLRRVVRKGRFPSQLSEKKKNTTAT